MQILSPWVFFFLHRTLSFQCYLKGGVVESCADEVRDGTTFHNPDHMHTLNLAYIRELFASIKDYTP